MAQEVKLGQLVFKGIKRYVSRRRDLALLGCTLVIGFVFILNVLLTLILAIRNGVGKNLNDLHTGDCHDLETISTVVDLLVNILSSAVLSASNFCGQILTAPTRAEVTEAHKNRDWLDIGAPSFRNLLGRRIAAKRKILWISLALSSIPLHLLWNSVFLSAIPASNYLIAHVTNDYETDSLPWAYPDDVLVGKYNPNLQGMLRNGTLERLEKLDCMRRFMNTARRHKDVVVVSSNTTMRDKATLTPGNSNSSLIDLYQDFNSGAKWIDRTSWLCSGGSLLPVADKIPRGPARQPWCTLEYLLQKTNNSNDSWTLKSQQIDLQSGAVVKEVTIEVGYCLSVGLDAHQYSCAIRYSVVLLAAVTVVNAIKLVCVGATWHMHRRERKGTAALDRWRQQPLITHGDAISSFLCHGDEYTKDCPLLEQIGYWKKDRATVNSDESIQAGIQVRKERLQRPARWYTSGGIIRWSQMIGLTLIEVALLIFALYSAIHGVDEREQPTDLGSLWRMGLGQVQDYSIALSRAWRSLGGTAFYATTLFANGAQLLMSFWWYVSNALLTTMVLSHRWGMFITKYRRLRVSCPEGEQKSSYSLSLPYRYSIPLLLGSAVVHWLLSQSLFVVQTRGFAYTGDEKSTAEGFARVPSLDGSVVGYSAIGMILSLAAIGVLAATLICMSLRHLPACSKGGETDDMARGRGEIIRMPIVSTCSAAISAACQRRAEDEHLHLLPLQWGRIGPGKWGFFPRPTTTALR